MSNEMEATSSSLSERANSLSESTRGEQLRANLLRLVRVIPQIGGGLESLIDIGLPDWKAQRVEQLLQDVASDVDALKENIDESRADNVQFGLMVEDVLRQAARSPGEKKLEAYRAILVNSLLPSAPSELEREYMLGLVERLQEIHIILLALFRDERAFADAYNLTGIPRNGLRYVEWVDSCAEAVARCLTPLEIDDDLIRGAIADLVSIGVLTGFHDRSSVGTDTQRLLSTHLEGFGRRFAEFVALPPSSSPEA